MSHNFNFSLNLKILVQDSPSYINRTQRCIERLEEVKKQLNNKVKLPLCDSWVGMSADTFTNEIAKCCISLNEYIKSLQALKDKFYNEVVPAADDINTMALELVQNTDATSGLGWAKQSIISLGDSEISDIQKRIKTVIDIYYIKLDCAYQIESLVYNLCYDSFIGADEISWNRAKIIKKIEQLGDLDNALGKYSKEVGEFEELVTDYLKTITLEDAKVVTAENYETYRVYVTQANMLPTTVPDIYNSERFKALLEMDPRLVSEDELAILTAAFSGLVEDNGDIDTEQMEKFIQSFYVKSEEPIQEKFLATGVPTCQTNLSPLFTMMYADYIKNNMLLVYNVNAFEFLNYLSDNEQNQFKKTLLINSIMQNVVYHMSTLELIYGEPGAEQFHDLPNIRIEKYLNRNAFDYQMFTTVPDYMHVGGKKTEITMYAYAEKFKCLHQNISDAEVKYINKNMPGVSDYVELLANSGIDLSTVMDTIPFAGQAKTIIDLLASIEENRTNMKEALIAKDNEEFENIISGLGMVGTVSVVDGKLEFNYYTPGLEDFSVDQYVEVYNSNGDKGEINNYKHLDASQIYKDFAAGDYKSEDIERLILYITDGGGPSDAAKHFPVR